MSSVLFLIVIAVLVTITWAGKDYYKILGITRKAKEKEIKKAYRKLALKWHPDKHTGEKEKETAKKKFQLVDEAYEVLSDDEKRRIYDQVGEYGLKRGGGGGGGGGGPGGGTHFEFQGGFPGGTDPFDLFRNVFGGGGGGQPQQHHQQHHFGGGGGGFSGGFPGGFPGGGGGHHHQQQQQPPSPNLFKQTDGVFSLTHGKFPDEKSRYIWLVLYYQGIHSQHPTITLTHLPTYSNTCPNPKPHAY